ncbi:MAG: response regulator transcription factor [Ignavibacteriales bacterium]
MNKKNSKVFIIDDDKQLGESISLLLESGGYKAEVFPDTKQFLERENYNGSGCILLDVFLKGKTGLELQEEIETRFECLPIIFITGHGDISMSVGALKKGAINFLEKPIDDQQLFNAIDEALIRSNDLVTKQNELEKFRTIVNSLTAREYEIFRYLITGRLNKQIASELGIAEHTVKNHRLSITEKLKVKSVAEMVYIAEKLNIKGAN